MKIKYLMKCICLGFLFVKDFLLYRMIPEKIFLRLKFRFKLGYKLNLLKPLSLNEKIQWLKLNDRTPLHTQCADKYKVRSYVTATIGDKYLIPLVLKTNNVNDICPYNIPDYPVIIKTNHDSGTYFIIRNKNKYDWEAIRKELKRALAKNYYYGTKEWQYKNIEPCIIIEKLLLDIDGNIPNDYKFLCIGDDIQLIQVDCKINKSHFRNNYSLDWDLLPVRFPEELENFDAEPIPDKLQEMISLARKISKDFRFSRIDFYYVNNKIYFGEITFHPTAGYARFYPLEWDYKLGEILKLPLNGE